ncbi:MAG: oligosaccharide flippase family protein [Melioribacteraceae bacterium]
MLISKYYNYIIQVFSSSLFRSSGIYTVSSVINAAIPFFILPILTRELTPTDYGIVAMFQLSIGLIYPFVAINIEGAIQRKYYDNDISDFPSFVGSCLVLFMVSFLVNSILFYFFFSYIHEFTQIQDVWIKYILIVAAFQFITAIVLVLYQVKVKPIKFGIIQITRSILYFSFTILFVVGLNKSWEGVLGAQILTGAFFSITSLIILYKTKSLNLNINYKDIKFALRFGLPLIPHAIGGILFTSIDRLFLTNMINLEQTGNYTVAYQLGSIIALFTVAFNNAYVPWLFGKLSQNNSQININIVRFTYVYFLFIFLFATFLLIIFPTLSSFLVGNKFNNISTYSTFIVYGLVFQGMYFMVTNYIIYSKKTYILAAITGSVAIIKLPITYYGILWFGAVGASFSYFITFFIFFIVVWVFSAKVHKMPWNIFQLIKS